MMHSIASPAKLNLGFEILGRRPDGYHDIATIFQEIDLVDQFEFTPERSFSYLGSPLIPLETDIAKPILECAASDQRWSGLLRLRKDIPVAAGLGGGSSNAALALRLAYGRVDETLIKRASEIGADVAFFLSGGTAVASGIGEILTSIPTPKLWFVVHTPPIQITNKTRSMFEGTTQDDQGDGRTIVSIAQSITNFGAVPERLPNAFEQQALRIPEVQRAWALVADVSGRVALSGAGPSVYSWHRSKRDANIAAAEIRRQSEGRTFVCRAISRRDRTAEIASFRELLSSRS